MSLIIGGPKKSGIAGEKSTLAMAKNIFSSMVFQYGSSRSPSSEILLRLVRKSVLKSGTLMPVLIESKRNKVPLLGRSIEVLNTSIKFEPTAARNEVETPSTHLLVGRAERPWRVLSAR